MGADGSKEEEPLNLDEVPASNINVGSSKIVTSGADLSKYLPEVAALIVRQKAGKAELASQLASDPNEARRILNMRIPKGDYSGLLMIHVIALYGIDDEEAAKIIVKLTYDINAMVPPEASHAGGSALHLCAETNNAGIATHILMLRTDAIVDLRDAKGCSPLHRAILSGSTSVARLLVRHYSELADQPVVKDKEIAGDLAGMNSLHLSVVAVLRNQRKIREPLYHLVDFLIKQGADVNARDTNGGSTPVHLAAAHGVNDLLYLMLNSREVKDSIDDTAGLNALHVAAIANQATASNLLLMRGFDVDSRGARGETPLMVAAMSNSTAAMMQLITKGADTTLVDDTGATALHYAAATGSPDAAFEILNADKLSINTTDFNGGTALHTLALRYTSLPVEDAQKTCQILIDYAINADILDDYGNRAYKYLPAEDKEAQALFGKSHLYMYDNFHDRHLEEDGQVRLPIGLPRFPVSRNWLEELRRKYGQDAAETEYQRDFDQRLYYFPGEPRKTPPIDREPEWWASERVFPYTEANKIIADRQDIGPRYPAVVIPLGPDPMAETFDNIGPQLDEMGNEMRRPYQRTDDRSHELPTQTRPDRRNLEETNYELIKRTYIQEVLAEQTEQEQAIVDEKFRHKWWMRSDIRNGVDRMPTRQRPAAYVPGMAKDEMLLQPEIEFPPELDVKKVVTDDLLPNRTPEDWMRLSFDEKAVEVRRPPTATRGRAPPTTVRGKSTAQPAAKQVQEEKPVVKIATPPPTTPPIPMPMTAVMYAPDGQQIPVAARPDGEPEVLLINNPLDGNPIQVVEGPGGHAIRVYEAPNGRPVIMPAGPNGEMAFVLGTDGRPVRIDRQPTPIDRASPVTSSIVTSRLGSPTTARYPDPNEQPTQGIVDIQKLPFYRQGRR